MLAILAGVLLSPLTPPVVLRELTTAGVQVRLIETRLSDPRVRVDVVVAAGFPGTDELFESMVKRTAPKASVNGAYFDKYSLKPIGDIWRKDKLLSKGLMGTALAITANKRVTIRRVERHRGQNWSAYETVLACGPALVLKGRLDVDAEGEGFGAYVIAPTSRVGVGVTPDNRLLLVNVRDRITFSKFADVMLALGCRDAMNLDAGASLGMYIDGKFLAIPGRRLTNVINIDVGM